MKGPLHEPLVNFCLKKTESLHGLFATFLCAVESWHGLLPTVNASLGPHIDHLRREPLANRRRKDNYDEWQILTRYAGKKALNKLEKSIYNFQVIHHKTLTNPALT